MEQLMPVFYVLVGIVGLCVGSFLNVVIYRVPNKMSISFPPSHCPKCDHKLAWYDNIPVLSYLILGGKCRYCHEPISPRYICVELLNTILWLTAFALFNAEIAHFLIVAAILSVLICVAFIDFDCGIIPDRFIIVLLVLLALSFIFDSSVTPAQRGIGFGAVLVFFGLIYIAFLFLVKKEGLGIGDIKLMTVCGGLLGFANAFLALLIASVSASIVLVGVTLAKMKGKNASASVAKEGAEEGEGKNDADVEVKSGEKSAPTEYPFAPFLAAGTAIALLFGDIIIKAYFGLFGL